MTESRSLTIAVIVAGTNEPSNSNMLADTMISAFKSQNVITKKIRLKDLHMAHFGLECYGENCPIDDLEKVKTMIEEADAVVIASPVWNFSVPAHLKNLIDRMGAFALDASHSVGTLKDKPFFLILTGGVPDVGWPLIKRTTSHLPISIAYFGGAVLGMHFEGRCTLGRGKFGLVVDQRPASLTAIKNKGEKFLATVRRFKETGKLPVWHRLKSAIVKIGQKIKRKLGL